MDNNQKLKKVCEVDILGRSYEVVLDPALKTDALMGQIDYFAGEILLCPTLDIGGLEKTIIHEVTHGYVFEAGFQQVKMNEEVLCDFLGCHLGEIYERALFITQAMRELRR